VRALVCVEKCVSNNFEEKRGRGKHNLQLLPTTTYVSCFEDLTVKPCLIKLKFVWRFLTHISSI